MRKKSDIENEIETVYTTVIRFLCPKRGWVEETVQVKKYRPAPEKQETHIDLEHTTFVAAD
jgi:hypothetical protein